MYYAIVVTLMVIAPLASIGIELLLQHTEHIAVPAAKWFVFWAVGARLGLAGLRQIIEPRYTARKILGIEGDDVLLVVRELGFANLAMGAAGLASLWLPAWRLPVAFSGAIFYGLAGINHLVQAHRTRPEQVAMVTDLMAAALLAASFLAMWT